MIHANEFRITNLVEFNGLNDRVYNLFSTSNNKQWNPIPLTHEWRERFGFEFMHTDTFQLKLNDNQSIEFDSTSVEFCLYERGKQVFDLGKIEFVHQLQNLYFALTGKELELKPKS